MNHPRFIKKIYQSKPVIEGAGVHLKRAMGFSEVGQFDPFLLLDDFRSSNPLHYLKGFPWHPHRGIETITYVLNGDVEHGDSMGNKGKITSGDVQWMTAGSGIIHQEMPKGDNRGKMEGFQLWANLPAEQKMMSPRYRDVKANQIPQVETDNGIKIKIISGRVNDVQGPVQDIVIDPEYMDITIPAHTQYEHPTQSGYTVFAYIISGSGIFGQNRGSKAFPEGNTNYDSHLIQKDQPLKNESLMLFQDGDHIPVSTAEESVRFLFISGKPLHEPVAWQGPIVMNTQEELHVAFEEYRNGNFIKQQA